MAKNCESHVRECGESLWSRFVKIAVNAQGVAVPLRPPGGGRRSLRAFCHLVDSSRSNEDDPTTGWTRLSGARNSKIASTGDYSTASWTRRSVDWLLLSRR